MSTTNHHLLAEQTVRSWFMSMSATVQTRDIEQHMQHVSKKVNVYGMPSKAVINYTEWKSRRHNELKNKELLALNYKGIHIISCSAKRITFNTNETLVGKGGKMVIIDKNIIIEYEDDDTWRLVEENVKKWEVRTLNLKKF